MIIMNYCSVDIEGDTISVIVPSVIQLFNSTNKYIE